MPLTARSPLLLHAGQNIALIWLSLVLLPLSSCALACSYVLNSMYEPAAVRSRKQNRTLPAHVWRPRTILVTGVGMTKGLALARNFYLAGHNVVGADFEPAFLPSSSGRVSKALRSFHRLHRPASGHVGKQAYANRILEIVSNEAVDIWVSCSGVASALEDGYAKELVEQLTPCKAIQFDVATTELLHEKHHFIDHVRDLGLSTPDTYTVRSKKALLRVLSANAASGKQYVLKYIGTDDSVRGDMTLLPHRTTEMTEAHVAKLSISDDRPWILQQYICGPEYCTHALVIAGEVVAFVACPSSELLMHYEALPAKSSLTQSMLRFTREVAAAGGSSFSGHCSFDFLVDEQEADLALRGEGRYVKLYPIECNPRAHTAVALFKHTPEMAEAYMTLLDKSKSQRQRKEDEPQDRKQTNGLAKQPLFPTEPPRVYWVGHDLITRLIIPVSSLVLFQTDLATAQQSISAFVEHVLSWQDGTFELWDPLPAFWLYHVYWPSQFAIALFSLLTGRGGKWSRVNVNSSHIRTFVSVASRAGLQEIRHMRMQLCCNESGPGDVGFEPDCYSWCHVDVGDSDNDDADQQSALQVATDKFAYCFSHGPNASTPTGIVCNGDTNITQPRAAATVTSTSSRGMRSSEATSSVDPRSTSESGALGAVRNGNAKAAGVVGVLLAAGALGGAV